MVRDRLRRLVRGLARRATGGGPRIPGAQPAARTPPTTRTEWTGAEPPAPTPEVPELELSAAEVLRRIHAGEPVVLVDVREASELWSGHARDAVLAPMSQLQSLAATLPRDRLLAIYCAAGARSYGAADFLRGLGYTDAWSIPEGFGGWIDAGGAWLQPATDSAWKLLQPVRLTEAAAEARSLGTPAPAGQVQAIERSAGDAGPAESITVRTRSGAWLTGLRPDELERIGRG